MYSQTVIKNKHQDGYPDLIPMNDATKKLIECHGMSKQLWSDFPGGGIEIKSTCGDIQPGKVVSFMDSRLGSVRTLNWKSHHRQTNRLLGLFWDFVDRKPAIIAAFYSDQLTEEDWGNLVQPKVEGGRTTSVSIMKKSGVQKMMKGCLLIDNRFRCELKCLIKRNLTRRVAKVH